MQVVGVFFFIGYVTKQFTRQVKGQVGLDIKWCYRAGYKVGCRGRL